MRLPANPVGGKLPMVSGRHLAPDADEEYVDRLWACPGCGERIPHQQGKPCFEETCPKCQKAMIRE